MRLEPGLNRLARRDVSADMDATSALLEPIPVQWEITQESSSHVQPSTSTTSWNIRVPADGQSVLTYTAHVSWCFE
ncbi:MAG: hypothetical protein WAN39_11590 [Candidatus Cybelea sp.]